MEKILKARGRRLNRRPVKSGPVVYWMSRDQRADDNWALLFAQKAAQSLQRELAVVFVLAPSFLGATLRQYGFMLKGLSELEDKLKKHNIPLLILSGEPGEIIPAFAKKYGTGLLIADFDPLKLKQKWKNAVKKKIDFAFYEIDAHNIIPCWIASEKMEYGAYTFRPKVKKLLGHYLTDFPKLQVQLGPKLLPKMKTNWRELSGRLEIDRSVKEVDWIKPGEKPAAIALGNFLKAGLKNYARLRNDPSADAQSGLSPYLHFGQLSAQRIALEATLKYSGGSSLDEFLDELVVRRELSDNFCYYNRNYDNFRGFPAWGQKTLNDHRQDKRGYVYGLKQLENSATHDEIWNAAQKEMVVRGKMHGYLRMYWAKKILEWSPSPEKALKNAIYLNDKYELDGRDPNGYAGIAWSIGGVHDRAFGEREIFGKVRYMSEAGLKKKFDLSGYLKKYR